MAIFLRGLGLLIATSMLVMPSLSCRSSAGAAALNTAIGVGAAAVQRSRGECYAVCTMGTTCNHATGYCEPIPCGGDCRVGETCRPTPTGYECTSDSLGDPLLPDANPQPVLVRPPEPGTPGALPEPMGDPTAQPGGNPGSTQISPPGVSPVPIYTPGQSPDQTPNQTGSQSPSE